MQLKFVIFCAFIVCGVHAIVPNCDDLSYRCSSELAAKSCKALAECGMTDTNVINDKDKSEVVSVGANLVSCTICTAVVRELSPNGATLNAVKKIVVKTCEKLPLGELYCEPIVNQLADTIYSGINALIPLDKVCKQIGLCEAMEEFFKRIDSKRGLRCALRKSLH